MSSMDSLTRPTSPTAPPDRSDTLAPFNAASSSLRSNRISLLIPAKPLMLAGKPLIAPSNCTSRTLTVQCAARISPESCRIPAMRPSTASITFGKSTPSDCNCIDHVTASATTTSPLAYSVFSAVPSSIDSWRIRTFPASCSPSNDNAKAS